MIVTTRSARHRQNYWSRMLVGPSLHVLLLPFTASLLIAPPTTNDDWRQLAALVVDTFDSPPTGAIPYETSFQQYVQSRIERTGWNLVGRSLAEQHTYDRYVRNARKMRGKKYGLYLAKEYNAGTAESKYVPFYETVGMIEMGLTLEPSDNPMEGLKPRAIVGVICVRSGFQKRGIGKALLQQCELLAIETWKENDLFVEIEPDNERALRFFSLCGYDNIDEMRNAKVCVRRKMEEKSHIVLKKSHPSINIEMR
mmetsp:Transcript_24941/g.49603  ORF Transcript_24941/g.49603 Transcript_24941/m.49603 type:complete len:254 (+) Transcript_24941:79-840(+)